MSFRTQMRLYLINLVLNPNPEADPEDLSLVSGMTTSNLMVSHLQELGWVSDLYGLRNLEVDLWHLRRVSRGPDPDLRSSSSDPCAIILFRVIVQALKDSHAGRPCDEGIWIQDDPPDHVKCRKDDHICFKEADLYLSQISDVECLVGVSHEFIMSLVYKNRRSRISLLKGSVS